MKKIIWGIIGLFAVVGIAHSGNQATQAPSAQLSTTPSSAQIVQQTSEPTYTTPTTTTTTPAQQPPTTTAATNSDLSNDSTYTNVDGNTVHAPAYSTDNSVPAGATAQCGDGTYSFSQNHSGTCSHRGGVAQWL